MMDFASIGLKEKKKKKLLLSAVGNDNIPGSSASTLVDCPLFADHVRHVGLDGMVDSPSISDRQADEGLDWFEQILQKAEYMKQAQHRRRSKMVVPQSSARVHDFELCLSYGNTWRTKFDSKSSLKQKNASKKHKDLRPLATGLCRSSSSSAAKIHLFDRFRDMRQHSVEEEDGDSEGSLDETSRTFERLVQRSALEEEVLLLQTRLEEELELRSVLESALSNMSGALTSFPRHLPIAAQELLADIAVLEVAVLKLKEKSTALRWQVGQEQTEREIAELRRGRSGTMFLQPRHQQSPVSPIHPQQMILAADSVEDSDQLRPSSSQNLKHLYHLTDRQAQAAESFQQLQIIEKDEDQTKLQGGHDVQSMFSFHDQHSMMPSSFTRCLTSADVASCEHPLSRVLPAVIREEEPLHSMPSSSSSQEQEKHISLEAVTTSSLASPKVLPVYHVKDVPSHPSPPHSNKEHDSWGFASQDDHIVGNEQQFSGQQLSPVTSLRYTDAEGKDGWESSELAATTPNQLSEQMVRCMVSIYCHLAELDLDSLKGSSSPVSGGIHSPTSPFGHQANSSLSSMSESSLLSFARSPLVDLRNKESEVIGTDVNPDPFKVPDKIPWMDIGVYGHTFEVPWLSVGKHQLEYAAQALQGFKLLVEQLASVDPSQLSHDQKLAFWINVYNTLVMHAYLAYGIPQSDLKFFSLLQKAAYTVGGHSFNAVTMEYCLLKSKSTTTRPQIMLLMTLHRNKLTAMQMKFGIDQPEPLINFALCCGTQSAPMVRIYTADKVHLQLQDAFHDYTQAAVGMSTKGKLLVPKLLYCYAREFVEDNALIAWICDLLSNSQVAVICECIQQRHRHHILGSRNFTIIPFDFTFRYLFPADIARKLMSF